MCSHNRNPHLTQNTLPAHYKGQSANSMSYTILLNRISNKQCVKVEAELMCLKIGNSDVQYVTRT
jgi:hypothetical protein